VATVPCPRCGAQNPEDFLDCAECGFTLAARGLPSSERQHGVDRTRNALHLLTLGFLLAWVPFLNLLGIVFALPGAALIFLGRRAFGRRHARLVLLGIAIYTLGYLLSTFATLTFLAPAVTPSGSIDLTAFRDEVRAFLWADLAATTLFVIGTVVFIFDLPTPRGRLLLGIAAVLAILGAALSTFGALPLVDAYFTGTATAAGLGPRIGAFLSAMPFVYAIPGAFAFAAAYFLPTVLIAKERLPRRAPAY
jgi:MFS family permease